ERRGIGVAREPSMASTTMTKFRKRFSEWIGQLATSPLLKPTLTGKAGREERLGLVAEHVEYLGERLFGLSDALTPPRTLREFVGPFPDPRLYREVANAATGILIERCGLRSDDDVLDIGCGVGQMAAPLSRYLSNRGSYNGFDIDRNIISWCHENITPRHPH